MDEYWNGISQPEKSTFFAPSSRWREKSGVRFSGAGAGADMRSRKLAQERRDSGLGAGDSNGSQSPSHRIEPRSTHGKASEHRLAALGLDFTRRSAESQVPSPESRSPGLHLLHRGARSGQRRPG